jgi:hypothetical protein
VDAAGWTTSRWCGGSSGDDGMAGGAAQRDAGGEVG